MTEEQMEEMTLHLQGKTTPDSVKPQDHVYSIFDNKMQIYMAPYTAPNDAVAIRLFKQGIRQPGMIHNEPEDYSLWKIGNWNPDTAEISATASTCIAKAHELAAILRAEEGN